MRIALLQHLAALTLAVLDVIARGARIRVLLPISLGRAIMVNTCGDALAAVTPARLGGEPVRFLAFQRSGAAAPAVLAAFATEVVVDAVLIVAISLSLMLTTAFAGAGRAWWNRLVELAAAPAGRGVTLGILAALVLGTVAAVRLRRRWPQAFVHGARDAWHLFTGRSWGALARVTGLTILSVTARSAILPALAARVAGVSAASLLAGSFVLNAMQTVLPIPAGLGAVDFGFAAWFTGTLGTGDLARLLVVWRFYSLALGALAGAVLLATTSSRPAALAEAP